MTHAIVILVFVALPAAAAAARIATYCRYGAHGRPDLEAGHARDFGPAEASARARHPSRLAQGAGAGPRARTRTRPATLRPVFYLGAAPVPDRASPWPSDPHIRREFDLDSPEHRGRAA